MSGNLVTWNEDHYKRYHTGQTAKNMLKIPKLFKTRFQKRFVFPDRKLYNSLSENIKRLHFYYLFRAELTKLIF